MRWLTALLLIGVSGVAAPAIAEEHVWIFTGQSNMKASMGESVDAVRRVVIAEGHEFTAIAMAWPGQPIAHWLESKPKVRDERWPPLHDAINEAQGRGAVFAGVVWHQGESDTNRGHQYGADLRALIARFREATGRPDLPVILGQLNAGTYGYHSGDWSIGMLREAQRRVAEADPHAAIIGTSDARVADFIVHLGPGDDSAGLVGERFGRAAASFVYRSEGGWGPQMKSVAFGNPSRDVVVVTFRGVEGTLRLGDAALGGFFASANTSFGRSLDDLRAAGSPFRLPAIVGDMAVPVAYEVVDDGKLALRFAEPLPETAALSWAATRHAAYGPKRRSVLEFDVVTDDSGVTAPSFAAVPIAAFEGEAVEVEAGVAGPVDDEVRGLIGVNGTNGMAVLPPAVEAGAPGWRQSNWNPASRYLWPHLIDSEGRVTDVYWNSYQHHQPRMQRMDPVEGDAALRAGLLGDWGTLGNLPPNTRIDLAIYLLQSNVPLDRSLLTVRVAHLLPETEKRRQQRAERHAERRFTAADLFGEFEKNHPRQTLAEQPVLPPAEEAVTAEWIVADAANDWRGNVLVLEGVETGPLGVVQVFLDQKKPPKDHPIPKGQRVEHKLLAVQARITVEPAR